MTRTVFFPQRLLAATLILPGLATAQDTLHTFHGNPAAQERFGVSVSGAGDVDGDGNADVIVGSWVGAGYARVFSGLDGSLIHHFPGSGDGFGKAVAGAGDVNGDGRDDLIIGARYAHLAGGSAKVYSGLDGSLLYSFDGAPPSDGSSDLGKSLDGAGDVNADGYDDLIVAAPWDDLAGPNTGTVRVYSGFDGSVLHTFSGAPQTAFGISVSAAGDVNADGFDDVLIGANVWNTAFVEGGRVFVYSGANGALLYSSDGDTPGQRLGASVAGAGDVNADGYADLIAGGDGGSANGLNSGLARVFSGADGSTLYTFDGDAGGDYLG